MDNDYTIAATIRPEWTPIDKPIQLSDICILASRGQEFLCGYKLPYEQFEYLYFGSFNRKDKLFAIQIKHNNQYYVRVLDKKPEQEFAFRLYKKARQNES